MEWVGRVHTSELCTSQSVPCMIPQNPTRPAWFRIEPPPTFSSLLPPPSSSLPPPPPSLLLLPPKFSLGGTAAYILSASHVGGATRLAMPHTCLAATRGERAHACVARRLKQTEMPCQRTGRGAARGKGAD
eukprot:2953506-Rhodomonas_salina.2